MIKYHFSFAYLFCDQEGLDKKPLFWFLFGGWGRGCGEGLVLVVKWLEILDKALASIVIFLSK
jgi:hypothetical protein